MKTLTTIRLYEIQDKDATAGELSRGLKVESHWNRPDFVVLEMLNGDRVTVLGAQLRCAIDNAMRRP